MARFLLRDFSPDRRKYPTFILAFIWCFGILCGITAAHRAGDSTVSLMRMAAFRPVSIVNLLTVSVLPFVFSAVSVYLRSWQMLSALCFFKALLFGFVSSGVYIAFGDAGWLVWLMIMFSDIFCLIPLWWYWITCSDFRTRPVLRMAICLIAVCFIVSLDYQVIAPSLVQAIEL